MGKGDKKTRKGKRFINSPRKGAILNHVRLNNNMMKHNKIKRTEYVEYIVRLDSSGYEHSDFYTINSEFQEVIGKLMDEGLNDVAAKADLDRQVFATRKSFDYVDDEERGTLKGLSWQTSGVQNLENGSEIPFYWPNVRSFTQEDFEYFEKRYKDSKNLYAKTEYGVMIYFGQKTDYSKRSDFKILLCDELLKLATMYYAGAKKGNSQKIENIQPILILVYKIALNNRLEEKLKNAMDLMFQIQQTWNIESTNTKYIPLNYSGFMSENYGVFKKYIDFSKVISRNNYAIELIEKDNLYNAADAITINDKIKQKVGMPIEDSLRQRAEVYERIADQRKKDMAALRFIELALTLYRQIKDEAKITELEKLYSEMRSTFPLNQVRTEIPITYIDAVDNTIKQTIDLNNEDGLLDEFVSSPWYETDDSIKSLSEATKRGFIDSLPISILDERGNTIKNYSVEEGKFWSTYSYYFSFGTMEMVKLFTEAIRSGKLSYESTMTYLNKTWLNEPIERNYNGGKKTVVPLDTIKPGLKRIFEEFKTNEINNCCDFVTIIDSLTLKTEGILRFYIEKIGIPTFASKRTKTGNVIMEKLFDDIIADLKSSTERSTGFIEDHRTLIKFVMSEKMGLNLRNEVAHSLLQIEDYTLDKVVVLFCLIIKLSKYTFSNKEIE